MVFVPSSCYIVNAAHHNEGCCFIGFRSIEEGGGICLVGQKAIQAFIWRHKSIRIPNIVGLLSPNELE